MELPEVNVSVMLLVVAGAATAFVLQFDAGSEELTRINLQTWWSAPERAREAGLTAPDLPPEWVRRSGTATGRPGRFLPFIRRWPHHDEVRVWPGAIGFIRSAPTQG